MKFFVEVLSGKLSSKHEFREFHPNHRHNLLQGVTVLLKALPIFLDEFGLNFLQNISLNANRCRFRENQCSENSNFLRGLAL
jgi:hypothetical protein